MSRKTIREQIKLLTSDKIWHLDLGGLSKWKARIVRTVQLIRITFDSFMENRMGFQCVALSYFGALATVPFAAFLFAVTGGLGLADKIAMLLYRVIPAEPDFVNTILEKAENIINTAKSGGVGLISALLFSWTIIWLLFNVERVFNNVWKIKKVPRKLYRRLSFYLVILALSPFVIIIFGAGIAFYSNLPSLMGIDMNVMELKVLNVILGWLAFYVIITLTISAMYKFIPATKVKYRYALSSALISGFFFTLFQYIYLSAQMFMSSMNGVYGALAAIPLFLIWMNFSWQIIIYGAQLTYAFQNVTNYK